MLLGLTFLTTTIFGFALMASFAAGAAFNVDGLLDGYGRLFHGDASIWIGLYFSGPLLLILLAHEFGHYLACRYWRVDASLPYFLPSPLLLGTFGAFIRIRSPIYSRKSLFDIGASGPFAGFLVVIPVLASGLWMSRVVHGVGTHQALSFGTPLVMRFAEWLHFGPVDPADILLHPVAMAAWAGLLATAMNLLPLGQLDGGHILYAATGERCHRLVASAFVGVLVVFGFVYHAWWMWAAVMFLFGRRHPLVYDRTPLERSRLLLSVAAYLLLIVTIVIAPVSST